MILVDIFSWKGKIYLWYKDGKKNRYFSDDFKPFVYFDTFNEQFSRKVLSDCHVEKVWKKHLVKGRREVLKITFPTIIYFKRNFKLLEKRLRNVGTFYNADMDIEEMYMFEKDLYPLKDEDDDINRYEYTIPDFSTARIKILKTGILFNGEEILEKDFKKKFDSLDPDIVFISGQQKELIGLCQRTDVKLNRCGDDWFNQGDGISYFSYGQRYYRESPLYLKGRLLLNSSSFMVDDFNIYSVMEGSRVCRMRIQRTSSHSVGNAITNLLNYQAYRDGYLIPYKVGIYEKFKPFKELVACDRGALTLEPYVGLHKDVGELDFVSMFPSIISRYNLSPEKFNCNCCKEKVVGTNYHFCQKEKGIVPKVCDFLIDRRVHFKKQNDHISKSRVSYLKWLLVVIFGFQAFRAKKIGCIEVHESINAIARETLLQSIHIAEREGYTVIHGIVDSLYVKKDGINDKDLLELNAMIQEETSLPIEFKKIYRFLTFLPSVNSSYRPVPTSYYGMGHDGKMKVRGVEIRTRTAPLIVKNLQSEIIEKMDAVFEENDLQKLFKESIKVLSNHIDMLDNANPSDLSVCVRIGREEYKANCPQKYLMRDMKKKGVTLQPGQSVKYIIEDSKNKMYMPLECYRGIYDKEKYLYLMKKAFIRLFLPFGVTMEQVDMMLDGQVQKSLLEWVGIEDKVKIISAISP